VGLQELLAYFHPTVAGVLAPAVILVGAALVPYIDRGPKGDGGSPRPSDRKVGVMLFTLFMAAGMAITFLGAFFRGPGYAWTMPWDGFFFAL
jgi:quinol-cytochrome oxidoreductase complex cytochrome b subunit